MLYNNSIEGQCYKRYKKEILEIINITDANNTEILKFGKPALAVFSVYKKTFRIVLGFGEQRRALRKVFKELGYIEDENLPRR